MNKILANIKSVKGVTGIVLVDKNRALTYELMPASFTSENIKNMAISLLHLGQKLDRNLSVDFFFENGLARIYNRKEQIIMILGKPDMNLNAIGVVCREAISAISRKLSHGQLSVSSEARAESHNVEPEFLLQAINIISANAVEKIGAYLVTKYLRQAKNELAATYPILTSITVDNNGITSFIRGFEVRSGKDNLTAFAHWSNLFLSYCARATKKLRPADIMELTIQIKDKLDLSGFYQLYADVGI
jgi:predicted regulator of Ras-like GTPase activity (Roadblock/LC7/MglB family)